MTAIGYIRISKKDQSEYSLPFQEGQVRAYAEKNNLNLLTVFKDDGESSFTFDRPDFLALEKFIKQNKQVEYLVIFDHDRFSRNLAEALMKIKELQDKYKIKVLATTDPFDTDFSDPSAFITRAFKYMMAESELHRIRQRTKNGLYQAALMGRHPNMAPYGYINGKDVNGKRVMLIDEDKANIVRLIFREYLNGHAIEAVRRIAKQYGYHQGSHSAIQRILCNPLYAGLIRVPARNNVPSKLVKAIHSPIISLSDYWAVQEKINPRNYNSQNSNEVPLRGALRCGCGKRMTAGNSRGKSGKYYWYYVCPEHRQNLSAVKLHGQWNDILDTLTFDKTTVDLLTVNLNKRLQDYLNNRGTELKQLQKDLKAVQGRINNTEEKYLLQPDVSQAAYNKVMSMLRAEQSELNTKLAAFSTNDQAHWDRLQQFIPKLSSLRMAYEKMDLSKKHRLVNIVFNNSLSHDGETYRTQYIHELFAGKELILKEKRLLVKEQPVLPFGVTPVRSGDGNFLEQMQKLADVFAA
jgi:site-specific DNA recombinase